jgi:hypothetical protein
MQKTLNVADAAAVDEEEEEGWRDGGETARVGKTFGAIKKRRWDTDLASEDPAAREVRELAEDIATAKKVAPFFCMFLKLFTAPASDIFSSHS